MELNSCEEKIKQSDDANVIYYIPLRIAHVQYGAKYDEATDYYKAEYVWLRGDHTGAAATAWEVSELDNLSHLEAIIWDLDPHIVVMHRHGNREDSYSQTRPRDVARAVRAEREEQGLRLPLIVGTYFHDVNLIRDVLDHTGWIFDGSRQPYFTAEDVSRVLALCFSSQFDIVFSMRDFYPRPADRLALAIWLYFHPAPGSSNTEHRRFVQECAHIFQPGVDWYANHFNERISLLNLR